MIAPRKIEQLSPKHIAARVMANYFDAEDAGAYRESTLVDWVRLSVSGLDNLTGKVVRDNIQPLHHALIKISHDEKLEEQEKLALQRASVVFEHLITSHKRLILAHLYKVPGASREMALRFAGEAGAKALPDYMEFLALNDADKAALDQAALGALDRKLAKWKPECSTEELQRAASAHPELTVFFGDIEDLKQAKACCAEIAHQFSIAQQVPDQKRRV